jgi:hypothetical protein
VGGDEGAMAQIAAAASPTQDAAPGIGSPSPRPRYVSLIPQKKMAEGQPTSSPW